MKNVKTIGLLLLIFAIFQQTNCAQNQDMEVIEFPTHTTEKYVYNKFVDKRTWSPLHVYLFGQYPDDIATHDKTTTHCFNNGITRIKTTKETKDGTTITTIETWTSRNPSYFTWTTGIVTTCVIGAFIVTGMGIHVKLALDDRTHPDHEYYVGLAHHARTGKPLPKDYFTKQKAKDHARSLSATVQGYAEGFGLVSKN